MHKKGISLNSVGKILSHSADKIRRRTLLCFERLLVSKIFKQRRGKLHGFVKIFLSHRTEKTSSGNHSVFQKISGREKNLRIRGGGSRFSVENFLYHWIETKNFVKEPLFSRKFLVSKKNYG